MIQYFLMIRKALSKRKVDMYCRNYFVWRFLAFCIGYIGILYINLRICNLNDSSWLVHDDVIKWKHFPRNWPFVRGIHQSLVNSPHKGQWRGALMFTLICVWINGLVNICEAGEFPTQRPVTRSFDVYFDLRLNKRFENGDFWQACSHSCRQNRYF